MISERQRTSGETLEYSLDALELTMAARGFWNKLPAVTRLGYRARY